MGDELEEIARMYEKLPHFDNRKDLYRSLNVIAKRLLALEAAVTKNTADLDEALTAVVLEQSLAKRLLELEKAVKEDRAAAILGV